MIHALRTYIARRLAWRSVLDMRRILNRWAVEGRPPEDTIQRKWDDLALAIATVKASIAIVVIAPPMTRKEMLDRLENIDRRYQDDR